MATVTAVTGVILLLFIGFVDISQSVAVGFYSADQLQKALNNNQLACKVTPTNKNQVNVTCKNLETDELPRLILHFQKANIRELQLQWAKNTRHREVLKVVPPFYCEVMKLDSDIWHIVDYAFVNVVGLRELYFVAMRNLEYLPLFGYLSNLKLHSLSGIVIRQLTVHSSYKDWHSHRYTERIFRGVESLETLILNGKYLNKLTVYDIFDLPNLKHIEPKRLAPNGFRNGVGIVHNRKRPSRKTKPRLDRPAFAQATQRPL